jgi:hypothetical protein
VSPAVPGELSVDRLRARERLDHGEFIALSYILTIDELVEVALIVVEEGWDAYPCLAAIFARLVEQQADARIWSFVYKHREVLAASTATWMVVAHTVTTSFAGNRENVRQWFAGWQDRSGIPLWIMASYAANLMLSPDETAKRRLREVIELAPRRAITDETASFFTVWQLAAELGARRDTEFLEKLATTPITPIEDLFAHPMMRHVNGVKRRPLTATDMAWTLPDGVPPAIFLAGVVGFAALAILAAKGAPERPFDWRTIGFLRDILLLQLQQVAAAATLYPMASELIALPRNHAGIVALHRAAQKSGLRHLPSTARTGWSRLIRERLSLLNRLKLAYF